MSMVCPKCGKVYKKHVLHYENHLKTCQAKKSLNSLSSSNSSIPCAQKSLTSKISSKTIGTDIYHSEESSSGEEVEKRGKAAKLSKLKTKVSNKHLELNGGEMACRFCNKVYKNLNLFERHVQACKEKNDNILIARANTLKVKSEESLEGTQ